MGGSDNMYYVQLQCLCGFVAGVLAGKRIGHRIQPQPGRLACLITRAITQGGRVVGPNRFAARLALRARVRGAGPVGGNEYQGIMIS